MKIDDKNINRIVISPLFVVAVLLTLLNDQILKYSSILPGSITGKISDFAGLFFFPLIFIWILRLKKTAYILASYLVIAISFSMLQLSGEFSNAIITLVGFWGMKWKIWNDPTDLAALAVLPLSLIYLKKYKPLNINNKCFKLAIVILVFPTCMFTSYAEGDPYPIPGDKGVITINNVTHDTVEISWAKATDQKYKHNGSKEFTLQEHLAYKILISTEPTDIGELTESDYEPSHSRCASYESNELNITTKIIRGLKPLTIYYINIMVIDSDCTKVLYQMTSFTTYANQYE